MREITEAALASYIATTSEGSGSLTDSRIALAFTYLTSPFALDLLTEQQVAELNGLHREPPGCLGLASSRSNPEGSLYPTQAYNPVRFANSNRRAGAPGGPGIQARSVLGLVCVLPMLLIVGL
jgi:hypothetical protein